MNNFKKKLPLATLHISVAYKTKQTITINYNTMI